MIHWDLLHQCSSTKRATALVLAIVVSGLVLLGGCGSSASTRVPDASPRSSDTAWTARWETEAARWEGVPHQWGGTTRRGIDCSALVQTLYRSVTGVRLPRTTRAQVRSGMRIHRRDLQPGDLVFFRLEKSRHVGVYLDEGRFVHASSSQGVMVSNLSESYWINRYWTARRIPSAQPDGVESASSPNAPRSVSPRGGW